MQISGPKLLTSSVSRKKLFICFFLNQLKSFDVYWHTIVKVSPIETKNICHPRPLQTTDRSLVRMRRVCEFNLQN